MRTHFEYPARAGSALAIFLIGLAALHSPTHAASTRGDFDRPPFYNGKAPGSIRGAAHVAVTYREEVGSLDPTPGKSPALAGLLDSLQVELVRLGLTRPLAGADQPATDGPQIRFGIRREGEGPPPGPGDPPIEESRRMTFAIDGPGRKWKDRVRTAAGDSVGAVVVIQLGFSEQWVRQTSWKGSKSIELGARRAMPVTWLTSLDDPVQVLQLTGALIGPDGRVLRVGCEGLLARRTGMTASSFGAQETLRETELESLLAPADGSTPVWRDALRDLVSGLLGR